MEKIKKREIKTKRLKALNDTNGLGDIESLVPDHHNKVSK